MASASSGNYELLDFGDGRKLERFGDVVVDRPCPAAEGEKKSRHELWKDAAARFDGDRAGEGEWRAKAKGWVPDGWCYVHDGAVKFRLELDALPSGQVGVFPEQQKNWEWIAYQTMRAVNGLRGERPLRVLNLFAYTGGSTLAAACAGAEIVHVDAARSSVERARQNAEASGLGKLPIRWIVEDATKFCQREVKRGNKYDAVILDPPTYGHGPKGEPWKIAEHLLPLLQHCRQLLVGAPSYLLLTAHSPGIGPSELSAYLAEGVFGHCGQPAESGALSLRTAWSKRLASGCYARWPKATLRRSGEPL